MFQNRVGYDSFVLCSADMIEVRVNFVKSHKELGDIMEFVPESKEERGGGAALSTGNGVREGLAGL